MTTFSHLHVHSQYSLLDGASNIKALFKKATADNMPAVAITDHGNMFGAMQFVSAAEKNGKKVKPIIGCEFYLVKNRLIQSFGGGLRDQRFHQLLLAKNAQGYQNLIKLSTLGYTEGLYGKYPRIDKELLLKYHEGLIATTCCLAAEVPRTIINEGEEKAEEVFKWWLDLFGEDYYIELQRHDIPDQNKVNEVLLKFSKKYNVKVFASNDSHYVDKDYANSHDILLCINTGEKQSTPKMRDYDDDDRILKGARFSFYNDEFYFKTTAEMSELFADIPYAIDNTNEIVDKVEFLSLKKDILLPNFPIPQEFNIHTESAFIPRKDKNGNFEIKSTVRNQWEYLKSLTYEGGKIRYGDMFETYRQRIDYELNVIHDMGFAGYFLIVMDFIQAARKMDVMVGCGRGSAAGSIVAYCLGIITIDPMKYDLLFERFLNPDRISMPDIDVDFDDKGRQKVIDYVVDKYGKNQVAQIITFGSLAAKSSIKDVARVLELDLTSSNNLAKLVPERPGIKLYDIFNLPTTSKKDEEANLTKKLGLRPEEVSRVDEIKNIYNYEGIDPKMILQRNVLREAEKLEGSIKSTGVHAAGLIIAPKSLDEIIPLSVAKNSTLPVTQYEGSIIESAGVIKMDFLGIKNLTIIKDAIKLIKENHGIEIDIDNIPFDDPKVFQLYQNAETDGTFQFESSGMKNSLMLIKPDKLEDLIALNALFRPGPMGYINDYAARKHGLQKITYDLPIQEDILSETYGITVYQEQVMLLSQKIASFDGGKADTLRKAMGKKIYAELEQLKPEFIEGGMKNGHDKAILEKIWHDWEKFTEYAFNKSHSTSYAYLAYQTAYLKTHYPEEFMSALLTANLGNIDELTKYLEECKRMQLNVLGPDVNESNIDFNANKKGEIRFGLCALKGVGEAAGEAIIAERNENGEYKDIFDFVKRVNLRAVNKTSIESLTDGGAFDNFPNLHRAQMFNIDVNSGDTFIEKLTRFGTSYQESQRSIQQSLFGDANDETIVNPELPECEPWSNVKKLLREKEVAGFFISGHPLDDYNITLNSFANINMHRLKELCEDGKDVFNLRLAGVVTKVRHNVTKTGHGFGVFTVEDYGDSIEFALFRDDYLKYKHLIIENLSVFMHVSIEKKFGATPERYEPKINQMYMLAGYINEKAKYLTITLNINLLDDEMVEKVVDIVKKEKGKCRLKVKFIDPNTNYICELNSKKYKINCENVVAKLKGIKGISMIVK